MLIFKLKNIVLLLDTGEMYG